MRISSELSDEEKQFRGKRQPINFEAVKKILGNEKGPTSLEEVTKFCLCCFYDVDLLECFLEDSNDWSCNFRWRFAGSFGQLWSYGSFHGKRYIRLLDVLRRSIWICVVGTTTVV